MRIREQFTLEELHRLMDCGYLRWQCKSIARETGVSYPTVMKVCSDGPTLTVPRDKVFEFLKEAAQPKTEDEK